MQISKRVKIACISAVCVVVAISLIVTIDKLNFVARWLGHLEAYKDNVERMIYACLLLYPLSIAVKKLKTGKCGGSVKGLKANIGIFGFEIAFDDNESAKSNFCDDGDTKAKVEVEEQSRHIQSSCRGYAMERKIISILSAEHQLSFVSNAVLTRGGCRFMPDGFAVRNGRAYIVEVKTVDRPDVIKRVVAQLITFSNMMQDTEISHVTVILCVVSDRPAEYFASMTRKIDLGVETEFIFRAFSPKLLEEMNQESVSAPL